MSNNFNTAIPILIGSDNELIFDDVGFFDSADFYSFSLSQEAYVDIYLDSFSGDADLYLYDGGSFANQIDSSANGGNTLDYIGTPVLSPGTYFIEVYGFDATDYALEVYSFSLAPPISDPGNNINEAQGIEVTTIPTTFSNSVGPADLNDFYSFVVTGTSLVEINLTDLTADADLYLLDGNEFTIDSSLNWSDENEEISTTVSAGTYYINVESYSGFTDYDLTVSAQPETIIPPDNAGNNFNTARQISAGNYSDWVGAEDTSDYYRFDLNSRGIINIALTGLGADADITLFNNQGESISFSNNGGSQNEEIVTELNAGTYYIEVYPWLSNSTNYDLSFSVESTQAPDPNEPNEFSETIGYGFLDASIAVAQAINASPFSEVSTFGGSNDWNVNMVNAPEVWAQGYTGEEIVVAVLDTGVDRNHPDLFSNIWTNPGEIPGDGIDNDGNGYIDDVNGWNFMTNKNNTLDVNGHGTHVAGTIAGLNNGIGVTGIAYNAQIMPVSVLQDEDGIPGGDAGGSDQAIARGIKYAVDNGADVINMSLSWPTGNPPIQEINEAIDYATSRGVIAIMSAGNDYDKAPALALSPNQPAAYATDAGIAVGAVNRSNNISSFSNRASSDPDMIYVTNPGVSVYSSTVGNSYVSLNGTSMAAPHVAGIVALMLDANPNLTPTQVRDIVISSTNNNPDIASFSLASTSSAKSSQDAPSISLFDDGTDFPDFSSGASLDIDQNSTVNVTDALLFYAYQSFLGGDSDRNVTSEMNSLVGNLGLTNGSEITEYMRNNLNGWDFDENSTVDVTDALLLYAYQSFLGGDSARNVTPEVNQLATNLGLSSTGTDIIDEITPLGALG